MNLLPLVALVVGTYAALAGHGKHTRHNPFRAYPGPPPAHALFGRLVGRFWWGSDPPAEVVAAREARKHHRKPAEAARPGELFAVPEGHRQRFEVVKHPENYGRATWSVVDREHDDKVVGEGILFAAQAKATAAELNSGRKADSTEGEMRGREGRVLHTG